MSGPLRPGDLTRSHSGKWCLWPRPQPGPWSGGGWDSLHPQNEMPIKKEWLEQLENGGIQWFLNDSYYY